MPAFHYTALNTQGKNQKGILHGDTAKQIRQQLREQQLTPLEVTAVTPKKQHGFKLLRPKRMRLADLALLTRQLATLLNAGLPVADALLGVSEQLEKPQLKTILHGVRARVLEGHALAAAMANFPEAFPELYCATVGAGEQTGRLDVVLTRLADYTEQQQTMRQKIQQALIYPSMMTLVAIGIVSFLLVFVVPKIVEVFSSTSQGLPNITLFLIAVSDFIKHYGLYLLGILIVGLLLFRRSLKNEKVQTRWHQILLKIPLIAYAIKTINTARFARTFGILSQAGVSVLEAMRVSATLVTNNPIKNAISLATTRIKEGASIHFALKQTQYFSPMSLHLIASGEAAGRLEEMLERTADNQDNEVSRLISTGLTLFEPMIILVMGAVVLFIVLAILLPIFELQHLAV